MCKHNNQTKTNKQIGQEEVEKTRWKEKVEENKEKASERKAVRRRGGKRSNITYRGQLSCFCSEICCCVVGS